MSRKKRVQHITLIGMPSAGKSKVGKRLAEHLGCDFVDIDDCIVKRYGSGPLQAIVHTLSPEKFAALESSTAIKTVLALKRSTIIATGGSMVYHKKAMRVLHEHTHVIHLRASLKTICKRVARKPNRGIVFDPGETLKDLYARRMPLYKHWAHRTVSTNGSRAVAAQKLAKELRHEKLF